jgi:hypothetical protein
MLEELSKDRDDPEKWLLPPDYPLMFMPRFDAAVKELNALSNGMPVRWTEEYAGFVRIYDTGGDFFGVAKADLMLQKLAPEKIIASVHGRKVSA